SNITRNQAIDFLNSIVGRSFFDETTFNILLIGSVEYRKGTHLMIKSIPRLLRALPNARICFIGHHGDNNHQPTANTKLSPKILCSELKKNEREKVAFTNYIPHKELPNAIMAGDVFPFLSLGDNFPGSVAEVSLMGKPIIALMTGGLAEMLTEDNKCLAYSLGSKTKNLSEKLVDALVELYGNPSRRKTIGRCLKKSMIKRYDAQRVVRETFEAYNNIYHKKKLEYLRVNIN
ncbi:MAG: glycosyltransferase family 4 protein, partial [bacterium]|nr:glycosyltransferase family 4 protein [bacterium]